MAAGREYDAFGLSAFRPRTSWRWPLDREFPGTPWWDDVYESAAQR